MNELKPCPFCGNEAEFNMYNHTCNVECSKCYVGTRFESVDDYDLVVKTWNNRFIPTCKIVGTATDGLTTNNPKRLFEFSCGHSVMLIGLDDIPNYCSVCGAKVVSTK